MDRALRPMICDGLNDKLYEKRLMWDTYHSPVDISFEVLTPESHIDARHKRAQDKEDNANQIQPEPYCLDVLRVADQGMVGSRQPKTNRRGEEEEGQNHVVSRSGL